MKIKVLLTTWDEGFHTNKLESFKKRYELIDNEKYEFNPFFYSDFFQSDFLKRIPKKLLSIAGVDSLYKSGNLHYMKMLKRFKEECNKHDIIMFTSFCAIHPDFLSMECKNIIKILPCVDDPHSSYERTVPYIHAVDVCNYVSLSYNNQLKMDEQLKKWGAKSTYFTPLGASHLNRKEHLTYKDLDNRHIDLIYVGGMYPAKIDRFTQLKNEFGENFELYGRWKPWGFKGALYTLLNHKRHSFFQWRVKPLSPQELPQYYCNTKIGINLHWGNAETGNTRLYELPANGVMQLCDRGAGNATADIFEEDKEIVLYDTIDEAIDKIKFYLKNDSHREKIALAGYKRVMRDYKQEDIYKNLFNHITKKFGISND